MRKLTLLFLLAAGSALAQDEILEIDNWRVHEGEVAAQEWGQNVDITVVQVAYA
jgi:hypothetical protein